MKNCLLQITMIRALIESAFETGYLSVESEGLLHQVLATKCYQPEDMAPLASLYDAVSTGQIKREASSQMLMESLSRFKSR